MDEGEELVPRLPWEGGKVKLEENKTKESSRGMIKTMLREVNYED